MKKAGRWPRLLASSGDRIARGIALADHAVGEAKTCVASQHALGRWPRLLASSGDRIARGIALADHG